ncbi:hypothetical protein [Curvivirga sp.]|uniref:hypothetical protein n=1 Tax=Curvivirga sp. TaxID=2856848 RepID=UPI003B5C09E5
MTFKKIESPFKSKYKDDSLMGDAVRQICDLNNWYYEESSILYPQIPTECDIFALYEHIMKIITARHVRRKFWSDEWKSIIAMLREGGWICGPLEYELHKCSEIFIFYDRIAHQQGWDEYNISHVYVFEGMETYLPENNVIYGANGSLVIALSRDLDWTEGASEPKCIGETLRRKVRPESLVKRW